MLHKHNQGTITRDQQSLSSLVFIPLRIPARTFDVPRIHALALTVAYCNPTRTGPCWKPGNAGPCLGQLCWEETWDDC